MTLSIKGLYVTQHKWHPALQRSVIIPIVIMLSVAFLIDMLNVDMFCVIMLNVVKMSVIVLSHVAPDTAWSKIFGRAGDRTPEPFVYPFIFSRFTAELQWLSKKYFLNRIKC